MLHGVRLGGVGIGQRRLGGRLGADHVVRHGKEQQQLVDSSTDATLTPGAARDAPVCPRMSERNARGGGEKEAGSFIARIRKSGAVAQ